MLLAARCSQAAKQPPTRQRTHPPRPCRLLTLPSNERIRLLPHMKVFLFPACSAGHRMQLRNISLRMPQPVHWQAACVRGEQWAVIE